MATSDQTPRGSQQSQFAATRWSVVLAAAGPSDSQAKRALAELCQNYWYPLYAFVRRSGYAAEDAKDLTQEFFARLLEKDHLATANPLRGRFRTFLLSMFKHFLSDEWDRAHAQKRGGGHQVWPIQTGEAETRYGIEPVDDQCPEKLFDRQWALTLLDQTLGRLRQEYKDAGTELLFEALEDALSGGPESRQAQISEKLHMSPGAVKVALHRLRRRYRAVLRQQIAETVATPSEVDEELRDLLNCL